MTRGRPPKEVRAHGEGSIFLRKDGRWTGASRYYDPETGKQIPLSISPVYEIHPTWRTRAGR